MNILVAGTFDRLHNGHKMLLGVSSALAIDGTLTVGVTDNVHKSHPIMSCIDRKPDFGVSISYEY